MKETVIIHVSDSGYTLAETIARELPNSDIVRNSEFSPTLLTSYRQVIFIGALGICVRNVATHLTDKYHDPAVVCVDSAGRFVISVVSGHVGGANELCNTVAHIIGAQPVITTQSDNMGLWSLDTMGRKYGWTTEATKEQMNQAIFTLVNGKKVALLLDIKDRGTEELQRSKPHHVTIIDHIEQAQAYDLLIAVTPYVYQVETPALFFRPKVLCMGVGCRKQCEPTGIAQHIAQQLTEHHIHPASIAKIATIDLKKDEPLLDTLREWWQLDHVEVFQAECLKDIEVKNPSEKVHQVTGVWGVAESCAIHAADNGTLLLEKQKGEVTAGNHFTFAIAMPSKYRRQGHIEIVGAGPGDPELVSVRGKNFLSSADLILYAGSLVPRELTHYAKVGCVVRSSASMNLEEQFALMKEFYDRGLLVVRLHTGDPCIYGAIQEQMAFFDRYGMSYHITPGISSFQAAAAALRSQFTIPEKVQTIILTRGEGRTPMPNKEKLHKLAASQSTMCIYLSASIVENVQEELLQAYPPETPVAACYKLTWKEEKIYRGQLKDLAKIVRDNHLTLTTLLVVGEAIDNRQGLSRLYDDSFKHMFRP